MGQKKNRPPRFWRFSDGTHICCINTNFLWSARCMGVKLHEESKYFIRIFATRLYKSIFAARLYAKKCKICVCTIGKNARGPPCMSSNIARNNCNNKYFLWSARYMGVKLHEESKYFIRIFATRLYSSLFAARLYAKKCKTCVCTHQPELSPGHARAAEMGWNHRFDDA